MSNGVINETRWAEFVEMFGDDTDAVRDVVGTFLGESQELVDRLDQAMVLRSSEAIAREAHTLRSISRQFGLDALGARAAAIEDAGRAGRMDEVDEMRAALQADLEAAEEALTTRLAAFE